MKNDGRSTPSAELEARERRALTHERGQSLRRRRGRCTRMRCGGAVRGLRPRLGQVSMGLTEALNRQPHCLGKDGMP